jgi:gliding motility-associated lipoprotein GldH
MIPNRILRNSSLVLLLVAGLLFASCNKNVVFTEYKTFNNSEWALKDKAVFDVEIKDTQTLNNIYLMVRHSEVYQFSNLIVFVTTKYPDGKVLTDTMNVILANDKGEWLGSGVGDLYDFKVPVKKNVRFPLAGRYQFIFEQGMRPDPLPMIMDFGFEIEKSK